MKRLLIILALTTVALAQGNHGRLSSVWGVATPVPGSATSTLAMSGTKTGGFSPIWLALGFYITPAKTLSKVLVRVAAVNGSLSAGDLVCDIYSDNGGPNSSLASTTTVTSIPTGATWVEFTGFSLSLSAQTQYWVVLRNADTATSNGNPIANFPTYQYQAALHSPFGPIPSVSALFGGWIVKTSSASGSPWNNITATPSMRLEYNDGTFDGFPFQTLSTAVSAGERAFGSPNNNEVGVVFTTPANANINVIGISLPVVRSGTPTGNISAKLYTGSSTTATAQTQTMTAAAVGASVGFLPLYFSSPVTLAGSQQYRITINNSAAGDTSSNAFATVYHTVENSSGSKGLMPYSAQQTVLSGGSPSWTDTDTRFIPFALILDPDGEFAPSGGGGQRGYAWIQ